MTVLELLYIVLHVIISGNKNKMCPLVLIDAVLSIKKKEVPCYYTNIMPF